MLEIVSAHPSIKIKTILLDNDHWFSFFNSHRHLLRDSIIENVVKLLSCKTPLLGHHLYVCPKCGTEKKIPHSCKSRFCTSCGKTATDIWVNKALKILPNVHYQHITFTMPGDYWNLFRSNRDMLKLIPKIAASIVLDISRHGKKRKHYLPGIFLVIHTFGRNGKFNVHIHLSVTFGGFLIKNNKVKEHYVHGSFIKESVIKAMWKYQITALLRSLFKDNKLQPYPAVQKHFTNLTTFNRWLDSHYQKTWNVYLQQTQKGAAAIVSYLGSYLKRPPIAETRIIAYDGNFVTFCFRDHYTHSIQQKTVSVTEFIKILIVHIPDKYFKMVRYYGFLANRVRTKYLDFFKQHIPKENFYLSHLRRFLNAFNRNPLLCPCGEYMRLSHIVFALPISTLQQRHAAKAKSLSEP